MWQALLFKEHVRAVDLSKAEEVRLGKLLENANHENAVLKQKADSLNEALKVPPLSPPPSCVGRLTHTSQARRFDLGELATADRAVGRCRYRQRRRYFGGTTEVWRNTARDLFHPGSFQNHFAPSRAGLFGAEARVCPE